jgi:hypothetical protein
MSASYFSAAMRLTITYPTITTGIVQLSDARLRIVRNPQSLIIGTGWAHPKQHQPHRQNGQSHRQPPRLKRCDEICGELVARALQEAGGCNWASGDATFP